MLSWALLIIYFLSLAVVLVVGLGQLHLALIAAFTKTKASLRAARSPLPFVSVQLPIYNEVQVVERLLQHVLALKYPKDKWELLVLDDSTDETTEYIERLLLRLPSEVPVRTLRREQRKGYKAGALAAALPEVKGEIVALFDADFMPPPDFLLRTVSYFEDKKVGFVQTRWGYSNEPYNLLTRLQAFGLNGHFFIEQLARQKAGYFSHFNGTAGLWRKQCIVEAGGWQSDTLTEDLDLSYRAQLKGWTYRYLYHVICPAELPTHINSIKQQQKRWCKGAAQTAKKHSFQLIKDTSLPLLKKLQGLLHLFNSTVYLCVFISSLLSVPLLYIKAQTPSIASLFEWTSFSLLGFAGFCGFYALMVYKLRPQAPLRYLITHLFWFFVFSLGLACSNSRAVAAAWLGLRSPFKRTPKQGNSIRQHYTIRTPISELLIELSLLIYFAAAVLYALYIKDYSMLFFHVLLTLGYGSVCWYEIKRQ